MIQTNILKESISLTLTASQENRMVTNIQPAAEMMTFRAELSIGLKGDPGQTPYEEWLAKGYTGTYEDFLSSIGNGKLTIPRTASGTVSALRGVWELDNVVAPLDYRDAEHIEQIAGITVTSADDGGSISVQRSGPMDDSTWNWTPGVVWLGVDGALTQVPPDDGFSVIVGWAVAATRLNINIQVPIALE